MGRRMVVAGTELLGAQLPGTVAAWIFLFVGILTALLTLVLAAEKFVELLGADADKLRLRGGGLALPISWAAWCILFLIAHRDPLSVLVVLLGTLALAIVGRMLIRKGHFCCA
jgi:hypothetical protein